MNANRQCSQPKLNHSCAEATNMPTFASTLDWQRADLLMQPTLIRVIDNIRKLLDVSEWQGTYHNKQLWPPTATTSEIAEVQDLQSQLASASPEDAEVIQQKLALLPQPYPGYELHLVQGDAFHVIDIWELCYRVCFHDYDPLMDGVCSVTIDTGLITEEGEVNWVKLDHKAKQLLGQIFSDLSSEVT